MLDHPSHSIGLESLNSRTNEQVNPSAAVHHLELAVQKQRRRSTWCQSACFHLALSLKYGLSWSWTNFIIILYFYCKLYLQLLYYFIFLLQTKYIQPFCHFMFLCQTSVYEYVVTLYFRLFIIPFLYILDYHFITFIFQGVCHSFTLYFRLFVILSFYISHSLSLYYFIFHTLYNSPSRTRCRVEFVLFTSILVQDSGDRIRTACKFPSVGHESKLHWGGLGSGLEEKC